jgi:hypothetical protein
LITLLRLSGIPTPALPALSDRDLLIKLGVSIRDHKISEIISDMEQVRQISTAPSNYWSVLGAAFDRYPDPEPVLPDLEDEAYARNMLNETVSSFCRIRQRCLWNQDELGVEVTDTWLKAMIDDYSLILLPSAIIRRLRSRSLATSAPVEAPVHVDFLRPLTEKFVQDLKDFDKRIGLFSKLIDPAPILLLHDQNAWTSVGRTRFVDQLGKDGALVDKVICWLMLVVWW